MSFIRPTRRELLVGAPAIIAAAQLSASPRLMPRSSNLRFFVIGDWGRDGDHYQRHVANFMAEDARNKGCDFTVSTGDNFYKMGVTSSHDQQWMTSFETIYSHGLRCRPWFPIAGNHDWGGNVFAQLDRTGRDGWRMPWLWYDVCGGPFGRPDVHLFFIDTVLWREQETKLYRYCGQAIRHEDIARQKLWLPQALAASRATTKLVFGHHPIYSVGKNGGAKEMDDLDKVLTHGGVSAYICGHDHCLYHIKAGALDYVCSGGGSEELSIYRGDQGQRGCVLPRNCSEATWKTYLDRAGYAVFEIDGAQTQFHFVDRDGRSTMSEVIGARGTGLGGAPPPDPSLLPENLRARARMRLPCTGIARAIGA